MAASEPPTITTVKTAHSANSAPASSAYQRRTRRVHSSIPAHHTLQIHELGRAQRPTSSPASHCRQVARRTPEMVHRRGAGHNMTERQ